MIGVSMYMKCLGKSHDANSNINVFKLIPQLKKDTSWVVVKVDMRWRMGTGSSI